MKKIFLTVVLILVGLNQMVESLERKIKFGTLSIIQKDMQIENNTYKYKKRTEEEKTDPLKDPLKANNDYTIHRDEEISIEIKDPNFFLFEYKWEKGERSKTEDFTALDSLIEALAPFIEKDKKPESETGKTIEKAVENVNDKIKILEDEKKDKIKEKENEIKEKEDKMEALKKKKTKSEKEKERLEKEQKKLEEEKERLEKEIKNLEDGKELIKEIEKTGITTKSIIDLSNNTENLYENVKKIPDLICKISSGLKGAIETDEIIKEWNDNTTKKILETYKKISHAQRILTSKLNVIEKLKEHEEIREEIQFISISLLLFKDLEVEVINDSIGKVNSFKKLFQKMYDRNEKVWEPYTLDGTISYSEKENIPAELKIEMNDNIVEEVKKCVDLKKEAKKTGTFKFLFKPYTPIKISFGLGEILSFLKEKEEGEEDEKNIKLTVPMITITPNFNWWEIKFLRPGFQVGGTVKDKTKNIVMGAGLQLMERLFIGGGIHIRWGDDIELKKDWYINVAFNVLSTKLE